MDQKVIEWIAILGLSVNQNYTPEDIKKAWKKRCNDCHPDKGGDAEEFVRVTRAYKMLTDPSYRQVENERSAPGGNLDVVLQYAITFEDAFFGRTVHINFSAPSLDKDGKPAEGDKVVDRVEVHVPAGTVGGHQARFANKGIKAGDRVGSLNVMIAVNPHPKFRVENYNVVSELGVPLETMLKGGAIDVHTMYGVKRLNVPAGTAPGERLKIRECGVEERGDHLVIVTPIYPTKDELKQKDTWTSLGINWSEQPKDKEEEDLNSVFFRFATRGSGYTVVTR